MLTALKALYFFWSCFSGWHLNFISVDILVGVWVFRCLLRYEALHPFEHTTIMCCFFVRVALNVHEYHSICDFVLLWRAFSLSPMRPVDWFAIPYRIRAVRHFLVVVALCIRVKALSYVNVNRDFAWSLLHIWMNCIELSTLLWGVEVGSGIDHWLRRGKYGE